MRGFVVKRQQAGHWWFPTASLYHQSQLGLKKPVLVRPWQEDRLFSSNSNIALSYCQQRVVMFMRIKSWLERRIETKCESVRQTWQKLFQASPGPGLTTRSEQAKPWITRLNIFETAFEFWFLTVVFVVIFRFFVNVQRVLSQVLVNNNENENWDTKLSGHWPIVGKLGEVSVLCLQ